MKYSKSCSVRTFPLTRKTWAGTTAGSSRTRLREPFQTWRVGDWNYVELNPVMTPAHILAVSRPLLAEA